jgi:hypothetical protein
MKSSKEKIAATTRNFSKFNFNNKKKKTESLKL